MKKKIIYIGLGLIINTFIFTSILWFTKENKKPTQLTKKTYSTKLIYKKSPIKNHAPTKKKKINNLKKKKSKQIKKLKKTAKNLNRSSKKSTIKKPHVSKSSKIIKSEKKEFKKNIYSIIDLDSQPEITSSHPPKYPEFAKEQGVEALVILKLTIGLDGYVEDIKVIQTLEGYDFDIEAIKAVKKWQFSICTVKGTPVQYSLLQPIFFKLE